MDNGRASTEHETHSRSTGGAGEAALSPSAT